MLGESSRAAVKTVPPAHGARLLGADAQRLRMAYRKKGDLSLVATVVLGLIAVLLVLAIVDTLLSIVLGFVSWFLGLFGPLGPLVALAGLIALILWALDMV